MAQDFYKQNHYSTMYMYCKFCNTEFVTQSMMSNHLDPLQIGSDFNTWFTLSI